MRASCCTSEDRLSLLLPHSAHTRILRKPLEETTFIAVIHGDSVLPVIAHSIYVSLSADSYVELFPKSASIMAEENK